ncbi:MAG: hypothetical protein FWD49_03790 [Firmicutes bacterium]|nr:hypothetical protein [Bacillota bacterium]
MEKMFGVGITSGLNRLNHYVEEKAVLRMYLENWDSTTPSSINHDKSRVCGFTRLGPLFIDPEKFWQTVESNICLTEDDILRLNEIIKKHKELLIADKKEKYDALVKKILSVANIIKQDYDKPYIEALAIKQENIVFSMFPELAQLLDKDNLIDLKNFTIVAPGLYEYKGFYLFAHQFFRRSFFIENSLNASFLECLQSLSRDAVTVKIAIDPNLIGLKGTATTMLEYQYLWGPKFSDDLESIDEGVTIHENSDVAALYSNIRRTEFRWYTQNKIRTFECEEICLRKNLHNNLYGCRFVHCMLGHGDTPPHFDGAVRAYTEEKMQKRLAASINKTGRDTIYTKLWRIDGNIEIEKWKQLLTFYFMDNTLIGEYLGGEDKKYNEIIKEDEGKRKSKKAPIDFLEAAWPVFSCYIKQNSMQPQNYDICFSNGQGYNKNSINNYIDKNILEVKNLLEKEGLRIGQVPECIDFDDAIINLPEIICNDLETASKVLNCIKNLITNRIEKKKLIAFTISVPYSTFRVTFSFAGHIEEVKKLKIELPAEDELKNFCMGIFNQIKDYKSKYKSNNNIEPFDLLCDNGQLCFFREPT